MLSRRFTPRSIYAGIASLAVCLIVSVLFGQPSTALAHANLVRSEPRNGAVLDSPPAAIRLWFSEAPEPSFSQVQLLNKLGNPVQALGPLTVNPADDLQVSANVNTAMLPPGLYTVAWRALSAVDGHVTAGAFAFAIGHDQLPESGVTPAILASRAGLVDTGSSSEPTVPGVVIRWLNYLSMALIAGGFVFVPLILQPALSITRPTTGSQSRPAASDQPQTPPFSHASGLFRVLALAWILLLISTLAGAVLQAQTAVSAASAADLGSVLGKPLITLLTATRYGVVFWFRALLVVGLGLLLALRQSRWWRRAWNMRWWWAGALLGAAVLLTTSLDSHAAAAPEVFSAVVADWLHLISASLWLGGLVALFLALRWLRRTEGTRSAAPIARLVGRFSQIATLCVLALGLSGLYRASVEVSLPDNLIDTPYGQALLFKLVLLLPLLGLAALNLTLISRRLAHAAESEAKPTESTGPYRWIRGTVGFEVILVTLVLLVTGILTSLPPSRVAFGAGAVARGTADDLRVVLFATPGLPGPNVFDIYLKNHIGQPVDNAEKVALNLSMLDHDMGISEAVATNQGGGHYVAQSYALSMLGTWKAELIVRRADQDDVRASFTLPLGRPVTPTTGTLAMDYSLRTLLGLEVIVAGAALLVWAARTRRSRRAVSIVGGLLAIIGFGLALTGALNMNAQNGGVQNPIPPNLDSLARGRVVYESNCAACHGLTGLGDGPLGQAMQPPPANLQVHMAAGHPDSVLFDWVTNGIAGSGMPAWGTRLSENERWDVINYIRSFATLAR